MDGTDGTPASNLPVWRRLAPFVVAAILLGWVLRDLDSDDVRAGIARVDLLAYLGMVLALAVASLMIDVATSVAVYRRMVGPIRFADLVAVRAASYVPGLLNYHVGQAWLTWMLVRRGDDPFRATAATLVINAATLGTLVATTAVAIALGPPAGAPWLSAVVTVGIVIVAAYLGLLALRPQALVSRRLLAPIFELGVAGHLWALAVRLPSVVVSFAIVWIPLHSFGLDVPLGAALRVVPPVVVLAALPITPAGVGTRDAVASALLVGFMAGTPEQQRATIVACTLTTAVVVSIIQIVISLLFTPRARRLQLAVRDGEAR